MTSRGELPSAASLKLDVCAGCHAIHMDLYDHAGRPFATAALPPENWAPFLENFRQLARATEQQAATSLLDADDPLAEVITAAIRNHSSPTVGRGDVHGGQTGYIVYELDGLPFIVAAIIAAVRGRGGMST